MAMAPLYRAYDWIFSRTMRGILVAGVAVALTLIERLAPLELGRLSTIVHAVENTIAIVALFVLAPSSYLMWYFVATESVARQWQFLRTAVASTIAALACVGVIVLSFF
jgi:hypothetical protein